jgi:hypothetical protein
VNGQRTAAVEHDEGSHPTSLPRSGSSV